MDYYGLIARRESCRSYSAERGVEREKLVKMLEAARVAPSACNSQPWGFTVVTRGETARALAKTLQGAGMNRFTDACPAFIVVHEEKATLSARLGGAIQDQRYAQIDIGLATAQLCLAATSEGLSTCIIGWFQEEKLRELIGLPKGKRIRLVVAVGYARDETIREKKRKPLEEIAAFIE